MLEPVEESAEPGAILESRPGDGQGSALDLPFHRPELASVANRRRWQDSPAVRAAALTTLELIVIVAWTLFLARPLLNLDPAVVPLGREYLSNIQSNHFWTHVQQCGMCALWNGSVGGGFPAVGEPFGSKLHPIVIVTTLIFGVVNGSKVALVASLLLAGLAQWWLGRELQLSPISRVWAACIAVAGGHLISRIDNGNFGLVVATATCSLVPPALLMVSRSGPGWRPAVLLGISLALAGVSGQAYMQFGLALLLVPAILFLIPPAGPARSHFWRQLGLALLLTFLLAAPFLIALLRFLPAFAKDTDASFHSAQPFAYVPLNLVIRDYRFYQAEILGKLPYPYLYTLFIGWIPVVLAAIGLYRVRERPLRPAVLFLLAWALLAFWVASARPLILASQVLPARWAQWISGFRFPSLIAGLAVPAVLGLAGLGLDYLLQKTPVLALRLSLVGPAPSGEGANQSGTGPVLRPGIQQVAPSPLVLDMRWLLVIPLLISLFDSRSFVQRWMTTVPTDPSVLRVVSLLRTPDLQWVNLPFGEQYWIEPGIGAGLKLSLATLGWSLADRQPPDPNKFATRQPVPGQPALADLGGILVYAGKPGTEYATVEHSDGSRTLCSGHGVGGEIDISCSAPQSGLLTIKENNWPGWQARVDGKPAPILRGRWLSVGLPEGTHLVQFRYRPWDVPLGLALGVAGLALAIYFFWFARD